MAIEKAVLFNVGNEKYGIFIADVQGIEKYTDVLTVPNAPNFIEGVINLRGEVIPIFSLRNKFGLSKISVGEDTKLIVTKCSGFLVGFQVDMVSEIVEIPTEEIMPTPSIIKSEHTKYIKSVAHVNGGLVILLDLDGLLNDTERENLQEIQQDIME